MPSLPKLVPRTYNPEELALVLLAWEAGEVSEGRMVELLDRERVLLRELKDTAIQRGIALAMRTPAEMTAIREALGLPVTFAAISPPETTTAPE